MIGALTTYDEVHMHLSLVYAMRGPPKSRYFQRLGNSVRDFCTNVTKHGEIERFISEVRALFCLPEEEDTYVTDEDLIDI
jgi:hypothetical protein